MTDYHLGMAVNKRKKSLLTRSLHSDGEKQTLDRKQIMNKIMLPSN